MQPSINQLLVHREGMEHAGEENFFLDQLNLMSTLLKCSEILMEGHFHLDMQGTPCCLKGQAVVSMVSLELLQASSKGQSLFLTGRWLHTFVHKGTGRVWEQPNPEQPWVPTGTVL